jgi:hypothetical protein
MAEIIRKTESTFSGPWLLDSAALAALDEIIDEQWSRLEAHKKGQIASAVRREQYRLTMSDSNPQRSENERKAEENEIRQRIENDDRYSGDGRTITLTLSSGNKVRVNSFREAAHDVNCQDHEIAKIEVKLYCGGIRGDVVVPTPDKSRGLSLVTLPEASAQADELFVRLHRWAEQYKPDWFRQICGMGAFGAWLFALMFLLLFLLIGLVTGTISEQNSWRDEVRELVAKGVKPEDHGRALELLLRKSADLAIEPSAIQAPLWFSIAAVIMVIVASLLSFPARTAFEIGNGAGSVRRQQRYDRFLRKIIPTFLIMGVLASVLGSFAFEYLRPK